MDDNAGLVAGAMVAAPELRDLLATSVGHQWLTQARLRRASVEFLIRQDRLSTLDTAESAGRRDVYVS